MSAERKLQIFHEKDAPDLMAAGVLTMAPFTEQQTAGIGKMMDAGYMDGTEGEVLVDLPGFSLVRVWFKKDYPLPLHSHDSDCLYYVTRGSLELGTETLVTGDSFFLPGGTPYTYRPGPDGVEVLEFRTANTFDLKNLARGEAFYEKAAETIAANRSDWIGAKRPPAKA